MSGPNFTDVSRMATSFESASVISTTRMILTGEGEPTRLPVARVCVYLSDVLRVRRALGRTFNPDENTPGKTNVVILSNGVWTQRFGSNPNVIGRRITLGGVSRAGIRVMPAAFAYPADPQAWPPIQDDDTPRTHPPPPPHLHPVPRPHPPLTPR